MRQLTARDAHIDYLAQRQTDSIIDRETYKEDKWFILCVHLDQTVLTRLKGRRRKEKKNLQCNYFDRYCDVDVIHDVMSDDGLWDGVRQNK